MNACELTAFLTGIANWLARQLSQEELELLAPYNMVSSSVVQTWYKPPPMDNLLAHVGASRRAPHFYSFIPGSTTGDFLPCGSENIFLGLRIPPYVVVSKV